MILSAPINKRASPARHAGLWSIVVLLRRHASFARRKWSGVKVVGRDGGADACERRAHDMMAELGAMLPLLASAAAPGAIASLSVRF